MNSKIEELKKEINKSIMIYIIGCCFFILVALASIWFGYYVVRYYNEHELPFQLTILSIGGGLLLWEMIKSFRVRVSLPFNYRKVTEQEYPVLFGIINEVTTALNISSIRNVYICPDAVAAVFIQPRIRNIIFEPQKNLVIGLAFLTQMDDEELRAMLYHEFGHLNDPNISSRACVKAFYDSNKETYPKELTEWFNNTHNLKVSGEVSSYATENPAEFIAETFAGLVQGKKFSDDVMALYKKYGGPLLS